MNRSCLLLKRASSVLLTLISLVVLGQQMDPSTAAVFVDQDWEER